MPPTKITLLMAAALLQANHEKRILINQLLDLKGSIR